MKILYSAFACNPYEGSESYCGWSWPFTMRNYNEVYVITRIEGKKAIERYFAEHEITNIKIYYCEVKFRKYIDISKGFGQMLYYMLWLQEAYQLAKKLQNEIGFDYIHHITFGDFRFIGKIWKLSPKFIFGPVGGAQTTPDIFKIYVKGNQKEEKIREWVNKITVCRPAYRKGLNHAEAVFAANQETKNYLQKYMKNPEKCMLMTENGVSESLVKEKLSLKKEDCEKVILIWSGRMIYRKGLEFLVEAISEMETDVPYEVWLFGDGPEKGKLKRLIQEKGLSSHVLLKGRVSYEQMQKVYQQGTIFVFPSLRETTGTVLFEAMLNKLPIISFRQNGIQMLADENSACLIEVNHTTLEKARTDFAQAMKQLIENPDLCRKMGEYAQKLLLENYTWEQKINQFLCRYGEGRTE